LNRNLSIFSKAATLNPYLLCSDRKDVSVGVEFKLLPRALFDIFQDEVRNRPELAQMKDNLLRKVRDLGKSERDLLCRGYREMHLQLYKSDGAKGTLRAKLAQTLLVDDKLQLGVIDEPAPLSAPEIVMVEYVNKFRPRVIAAFQAKFVSEGERIRAMHIVEAPEVPRSPGTPH
jgi:hypothetical protein